ncbi:MAG: peptidylprolyl isomerase [Nitrospirota bacterium]
MKRIYEHRNNFVNRFTKKYHMYRLMWYRAIGGPKKDFSMLKFKTTLVILLFFILSVASYAAILLDRVVAVVNKEVITWSELYKMMEFETTEQVKALKQEERMRIFKDNEAAFLERLIDIRLQMQEAKRLGLEVTPEEVIEAIENIKKKYSMTHTDFIESLQKEGLNLDEYKKRLSEQIMISKVVSQQIRNKIVVSDDDIKKYIETNMEIHRGGEAYKLRQIFFKRPGSAVDKKTVEDKASMIIQKLKAGEDFSVLAKIYSEDPSGKSGGELGIIKKSQMAREFIDVVSTMKAGDFSMPFWTENGLHIIKLDGKVSEQNIGEIREDIRKQLTEEQFLERYKSWSKGLREKAYIEIKL